MKPTDMGVGIDIVSIKRFKKRPYESHKKFYEKIFSSSEINYCLKFNEPYRHFAGKFAVKEAVKKALPAKIGLLDIKTGHHNSKPIVSVRGKKWKLLVSLSHEEGVAVAVVIAEMI